MIRSHSFALFSDKHVRHLCSQRSNDVVLSQSDYTDVSSICVCVGGEGERSQDELSESLSCLQLDKIRFYSFDER